MPGAGGSGPTVSEVGMVGGVGRLGHVVYGPGGCGPLLSSFLKGGNESHPGVLEGQGR